MLQKIKDDLLNIIDDMRLQALNHLLRNAGENEWHSPELRKTYDKTKTAYETFNNQVADEGKGSLEAKNKKTNWELWVEIYSALSSKGYTKNTAHEAYFDELEQMGLIERTVKLK